MDLVSSTMTSSKHNSLPEPKEKSVRVAVWQGDQPTDVARGVESLKQVMKHAANNGASFVLLPELVLTGYNKSFTRKQMLEFAVQCSAALVDIQALAKELNIGLCFGLPLQESAALYNAAVVIDLDGSLCHTYRKQHLYGAWEKRVFDHGPIQGQPWVSGPIQALRGFRAGVLICYDIEFPEPARMCAIQGADVLLVPTALGVEPCFQTPLRTIPTRAYENQTAVLYSNFGGSPQHEFCGHSAVVGFDGTELARARQKDTMLLTATVSDTARRVHQRRNPYLQERRPRLYAPLAAHRPGLHEFKIDLQPTGTTVPSSSKEPNKRPGQSPPQARQAEDRTGRAIMASDRNMGLDSDA